jgi:hypothetical protein
MANDNVGGETIGHWGGGGGPAGGDNLGGRGKGTTDRERPMSKGIKYNRSKK